MYNYTQKTVSIVKHLFAAIRSIILIMNFFEQVTNLFSFY